MRQMPVGTNLSRPSGNQSANKDVINRSLQAFLLIHRALLKKPPDESKGNVPPIPKAAPDTRWSYGRGVPLVRALVPIDALHFLVIHNLPSIFCVGGVEYGDTSIG